MQKLQVTSGFRFLGKFYPESKKQQELPADAARFALKEGFAVDPAAKKKAAEPEANKSLGSAPENK